MKNLILILAALFFWSSCTPCSKQGDFVEKKKKKYHRTYTECIEGFKIIIVRSNEWKDSSISTIQLRDEDGKFITCYKN